MLTNSLLCILYVNASFHQWMGIVGVGLEDCSTQTLPQALHTACMADNILDCGQLMIDKNLLILVHDSQIYVIHEFTNFDMDLVRCQLMMLQVVQGFQEVLNMLNLRNPLFGFIYGNRRGLRLCRE